LRGEGFLRDAKETRNDVRRFEAMGLDAERDASFERCGTRGGK